MDGDKMGCDNKDGVKMGYDNKDGDTMGCDNKDGDKMGFDNKDGDKMGCDNKDVHKMAMIIRTVTRWAAPLLTHQEEEVELAHPQTTRETQRQPRGVMVNAMEEEEEEEEEEKSYLMLVKHRERVASTRQPTVMSTQAVHAGQAVQLLQPWLGSRMAKQLARSQFKRHGAMASQNGRLHLCPMKRKRVLLRLRAATCCEQLRKHLGCTLEEGSSCLGYNTCSELRQTFDCNIEFECAESRTFFPEGFSCNAFPQVACILVRILKEVEDIHISENLCRAVGMPLTNILLSIPLHHLRSSVHIRHQMSHTARDSAEPLERLLGTALVMAYLENAAQGQVLWELPDERRYEWYLDIFRVYASISSRRAGWYHNRVLWNLVFLQRTDGSFRVSAALATVLCAGDTSFILTESPTGGVRWVHSQESLEEYRMEAEAAVSKWVNAHVQTMKQLRWHVMNDQEQITLVSSAVPETTWRERREDLRLKLKSFIKDALNSHPWARIAIVGPCAPVTRAQHILNQTNLILLMLLCCLWFFYSKAATCCEQLRKHLGCTLEEGSSCLGYNTCSELRQTFDCNIEFECAESRTFFPEGFSCNAFPQNTIMDQLYLGLYVVAMTLPVSLLFMTLFEYGGTYEVSEHWDQGMHQKAAQVIKGRNAWSRRLAENVVFLFYTLWFEQALLSRSMARVFRMFVMKFDIGFLQLLRRGLGAVHHGYVTLKQSLWFCYQVRVRRRPPEVVFEEVQIMLRVHTEARQLDPTAPVVHQRHEMDSILVAFSVYLIMLCWAVIIYILIVYATLVRDLMGAATERTILKAWVVTLLFDNLFLQVLKSMTIKIWIKSLMEDVFEGSRATEASLGMWYEGYMKSELPTMYTLVDDRVGDDEIEYDVAGIGMI
eukprot:gene392-745_t